jgi:ribosome-associated protein
MSDLVISGRIVIAEGELEERFVRSSGPGGQNVNKVSSAVQLRFNVLTSQSLPDRVREVLLRSGRLTREHELVIVAQRFREQERNRADARARLVEIIAVAAVPPKPRRATKIPKASKRERLDTKKRRSAIKEGRGRPGKDL